MTSIFQGVRAQFRTIRRRTRITTAVSVVVHVLLLLVLHQVKPEPPPDEGLVEISWVELPAAAPVQAPVAPPARVERAAPKREEIPKPLAPRLEEMRVPRELVRADTKPTPQRDDATRDMLRSKLASVRDTEVKQPTQVASFLPQTELPRRSIAAAAAMPAEKPRELARDAGVRETSPSELLHAPARDARPSTELAQLLDEPSPTMAAPVTDAVLEPREVLAGVSLAGPVADRELITWALPEYPEWAKVEAVEGTVRLRFVVAPNGEVKRNVMIEKTSGFEDFDRNAQVALLAWQFEALEGATADQWGSITLNYRLDGP